MENKVYYREYTGAPEFSILSSSDYGYHSYFFRFAMIVLIDEIFMVLFKVYLQIAN